MGRASNEYVVANGVYRVKNNSLMGLSVIVKYGDDFEV